MVKRMSEKTRKKINAEINKNLGDDPNRIVNKLKVDPRPTFYPKDQNRYSQILQTRKDEKRIREEQKLKIPHIANKKRLVKRWQVEAEELNLSPDEEVEIEEDETGQTLGGEMVEDLIEEDLEESSPIGDGIEKELSEIEINSENEVVEKITENEHPLELNTENTSLLQKSNIDQMIPEPSRIVNPSAAKESQRSVSPEKIDESEVMVIKSGRITCPKCGNVNRNMMREVEDRSHIIMDYPLMFGRKFICGKCNTQFRKED